MGEKLGLENLKSVILYRLNVGHELALKENEVKQHHGVKCVLSAVGSGVCA